MEIKTLEDANALIRDKIEESNTLEYKRELVSDNKEIAKDISAFANTNGGTIIYGVDCQDRIPSGISWIADKGVEERIQNIVGAHLQPKLEAPQVVPLANPSDNTEAVYVVIIPSSLNKPHMVNQLHRYYIRRGSESVPMEDADVKNAILGAGRLMALQYEISSNVELAERTRQLMEQMQVYASLERKPIALIPFHMDAWTAIIASGLLFSLDNAKTEKLVKAYRFIHEMNSIISSVNTNSFLAANMTSFLDAHTPLEPSSGKHGIYLVALLERKLPQLENQLRELAGLLSA